MIVARRQWAMKLKRRVVEKKYEKEIAEFYADEATAKG